MNKRGFGVPVLVAMACMAFAPLAAGANKAADAKVYTFKVEVEGNGVPASVQPTGEGDATATQLRRELSQWLIERNGGERVTTWVRVSAIPASAGTPAKILSATAGPAPDALTAPAYPSNARRLGHEGVVVLELAMDASGAIQGVQVRDTFGRIDRAMANAAVAAARGWSFRAERVNGTPQPATLLMPVCFSVSDAAACEWIGPNAQAYGRDTVLALAPAARLAIPTSYALK